ncbi:MAG: M3 family oligoendopeptidase [Holosporales bacterium]|jgi:oligoendopeptidase F|nr:M3 family oligoendopeptidase [Holosporales bacterium]
MAAQDEHRIMSQQPFCGLGCVWRLEDVYESPDSEQLKSDFEALSSLAEEFRNSFKDKIAYSSSKRIDGRSIEAQSQSCTKLTDHMVAQEEHRCDEPANFLGVSTLSNLLDAVLAYEKIIGLATKLSSYAYLYLQTRLNDHAAQSFYQSISESMADIESKIVFFSIEISRMDVEALTAECEFNQELGRYKSWLLNCMKYKDHMLSSDTEEALIQMRIVARDAWIRLYDELLSRLEFAFEGESKRLPEMLEIANHAESSDTREMASRTISTGLHDAGFYINHIYNNILLERGIENKLRKYAKPESFRHLNNDIDQEAIDSLTEAVIAQYKTTSHKYYELKARLLKKEKLEYWDRNAIINSSGVLNKKFEYVDACDMVLDVFGAFSGTFADIAKEFIGKRWIDVYPKEGKTSGAFSHSCSADVHPYILLNHFGSLNDVFTLAHELGHGIHQKLSSHNGHILSETPLTLSEVASLFAEKLLFERMLKTVKTDAERVDLLCSKLDGTVNAVMRQIAFFKFERMTHEKRRHGDLSFQDLSDIFMFVQRKCLGDYVNIDDCISCYWCYISHFFHTPFYVYAYAFGEIFVNALYGVYETTGDDDDDFVEKYTRMLSRGGIDRYDTAAAAFGLKPMTSAFWGNGVKYIAAQVEYLERLCGNSIFT